MDDVDLSEFDHGNPDKEKINEGIWVPCRICVNAFRRIRLTKRYCAECEAGACEGEHLSFAIGRRGCCIQCGPRATEFS